MQSVGFAVILIFALIGVHTVMIKAIGLFLPKDKGGAVVILDGHMENVEYLILSALFSTRGIVKVINKSADEQTLEIACRMALDHKRIHIENASSHSVGSSPSETNASPPDTSLSDA